MGSSNRAHEESLLILTKEVVEMKYTKQAFDELVKQVDEADKRIQANVRQLPVKGVTEMDWKRIKRKGRK
jgi:soluble cytochrome b562